MVYKSMDCPYLRCVHNPLSGIIIWIRVLSGKAVSTGLPCCCLSGMAVLFLACHRWVYPTQQTANPEHPWAKFETDTKVLVIGSFFTNSTLDGKPMETGSGFVYFNFWVQGVIMMGLNLPKSLGNCTPRYFTDSPCQSRLYSVYI